MKRRKMHSKRIIIVTLKGTLFLAGLYLWGDCAPILFYISPAQSLLSSIPALLILIVWILFILRSAFFAYVRQILKPVWLPAILCWLIPVVALMTVSCIEGKQKLGFPFPVDAGGYEEPWPACFNGLLPQMVLMLCVLAIACIANRFVKKLSKSIKYGILTAFGLLCMHSTYWARNRFEYSWSTWTNEEMLYDVFIWGRSYLLFWLCIGLILAWRIVGELWKLKLFGTLPDAQLK